MNPISLTPERQIEMNNAEASFAAACQLLIHQMGGGQVLIAMSERFTQVTILDKQCRLLTSGESVTRAVAAIPKQAELTAALIDEMAQVRDKAISDVNAEANAGMWEAQP